MQLFDTHEHFESADWDEGADGIVARARAAGVVGIVAVGGSVELNTGARYAAERFPGFAAFTLGMGRHVAAAMDSEEAVPGLMAGLRAEIVACGRNGLHPVALGEMGLDYYHAAGTAERQRALFRAELGLARELDLPVVIHTRDADSDTLALLDEHVRALPRGGRRCPGVVHCFTGSLPFAEALTGMGFMISFSGILTFANAKELRAVAARLPDECLLVETDSPYLAPVPHRGKRNEPAHVAEVVRQLAAVRKHSVEHISELTRRNAGRLFS